MNNTIEQIDITKINGKYERFINVGTGPGGISKVTEDDSEKSLKILAEKINEIIYWINNNTN